MYILNTVILIYYSWELTKNIMSAKSNNNFALKTKIKNLVNFNFYLIIFYTLDTLFGHTICLTLLWGLVYPLWIYDNPKIIKWRKHEKYNIFINTIN